ncbi:MAG: P-loop NTPase [Leptolinea sp.]|nr:P-loop NTPase [Leptolinea sp.]
MKQFVILSGKGGTGKTSVCAAFAWLCSNNIATENTTYVDADVDAANLSLVLQPTSSEQHEFWGGSLAEINENKCGGCGACVQVCRYDAIFPSKSNPQAMWVDQIACDGCAACVYACPDDAIQMVKQQEGFWYRSQTRSGVIFHAELFPGRDNSGKLVTMVRQQARLHAEDNGSPLIIIDGPPGIGCPVISACAGVDHGLIIAEPSQAGIHDLKRIISTLDHFKVPSTIVINKSDIYPQGSEQIRQYASEHELEVIGEIPFDEAIPNSTLQGKTIFELFPDAPAAKELRRIWSKLTELVSDREKDYGTKTT